MTRKEYIAKAELKHNKKYGYSLLPEKIISKDKITIICPEHGERILRADMHLHGSGCQICAKQTYTTADFIKFGNNRHNKKYDYSEVVYVCGEKQVTIICHEKDSNGIEHGRFNQIARNHLHGAGCPKCSGNKKLTKTEFIELSDKKHNKKYDYSEVYFSSNKDYVIINCHELDYFGNEHGEFTQRVDAHLFGVGCPKCCHTYPVSTKEFIFRANTIQNKLRETKNLSPYTYEKTIITKILDKTIITCHEKDSNGIEHGDFEQIAHNHLSNREGCPKCAMNEISYLELELREYIESLISKDLLIYSDRKILEPNELDVYIPSINIAFEFNGLYWHSEEFKPNNYHYQKTKECMSKDIRLIQIFEDEWLDKKEIVKSRIKNILGLTNNKIMGRKCFICEVSIQEEREFLNSNHLQGYVASKYCYGLYYENELVSLMSFGALRKNLGYSPKENVFELLRFSNKINTTIIGGASKLFKHFINSTTIESIISYADLRYSYGDLYQKLGFKKESITVPNYYYIQVPQKRINRFNLRKDILVSKYGCPPEMTEHEFCIEKGWYRIYDCGSLKYVWTTPIEIL